MATGQREHHNSPHAHIFHNGKALVPISLDPPFDPIVGNTKNVPGYFVKSVKNYLSNNTEYVHFLWDTYSGQTYYQLWDNWTIAQREEFRLRHNADFPKWAF